MEMNPLHSPHMLRERTMLVQRDKVKDLSRDSKKEEREDATIVTGLATMLESVLIRMILHGMTTITTISKEMEIKGTKGSTTKERGMLPLLNMVMVDLQQVKKL